MSIQLPALSVLKRAVGNEARYGAALYALALLQQGANRDQRPLPERCDADIMAFVRNPFLRQFFATGMAPDSDAALAVLGRLWSEYAGHPWPTWLAQAEHRMDQPLSVRHALIEFRRCPVVVLWSQGGLGMDALADSRVSHFDSAQFDGFLVTCRSAVELLGDLPPDFTEVFAQGLTLVPIASKEDTHESFSTWNMPGVLFLSATPDHGHFLEAMLHEACHHILNGLSRLEPLALSDEPVFDSPWRTDRRPACGVLHGIFVFSNVACLQWQRIRAEGGGDKRLQRRHQQTMKRLGEALHSLPSDVLTPLGREVFDLCSNHFEHFGRRLFG